MDDTGVETGLVVITDSGSVTLDQEGDNTRLIDACPITYGDTQEHSGSRLELVADKLVLDTIGSDGCQIKKITLSRLRPVKGSMVGTWLEDPVINSQGNATFGPDEITTANLDNIFQIYFSDTLIQIVLDCDNSGCNDEQNGLLYAKYTFSNNKVIVGDVLQNTVSLSDTSPVITKGDEIPFEPSSENDTRRSFLGSVDTGTLTNVDRLLSTFDLQGDYKPGSPIKQQATSQAN